MTRWAIPDAKPLSYSVNAVKPVFVQGIGQNKLQSHTFFSKLYVSLKSTLLTGHYIMLALGVQFLTALSNLGTEKLSDWRPILPFL